MKHKDSIRNYRLTWRNTMGGVPLNSFHAYTDDADAAEDMASGLRAISMIDVIVYAWNGKAYAEFRC